MLTHFITIAITAAIVSACFLYHYEVCRPIREEQLPRPYPLKYEWFDFIRANIAHSASKWQCHQCRKLIILFDVRFRKETPPHIFNDWVDTLYNVLDTKYKLFVTEDDCLSDFTSEDAVKKLS